MVTATFDLTLLIKTSEMAFMGVKFLGVAYLIYLGIKVLKSLSLINLEHAAKQPIKSISITGFLSAALNPKLGLFVLAFIPQFVNPELGFVTIQMLAYGMWFAFLTAAGFSLMGVFSSKLSSWLKQKPKVINALNMGAGFTSITSGLAVAALKQK
nr:MULTISPECIES: LysE family translocator [unclassified Pseudoalteromonas]